MTSVSKTAWITGASQGIGRSLALEMAQHGYTVFASARNQDNLDSLVAASESMTGHVISFPLDVMDQQAVNQVVQSITHEYGKLDQVILNAGTFLPMPAKHFKADIIKQQFDLNVIGLSYCLEAVIPVMREQKSGLIAVNASLAGYRGLPKSSGYGATKAALINMSESLYLDLKTSGIDVKVINPGFVKTPLTDKNDFPMPFLIESEEAAKIIFKGLNKKAFEIRFPSIFSGTLSLLRKLPYSWYFWLIGRTYKP